MPSVVVIIFARVAVNPAARDTDVEIAWRGPDVILGALALVTVALSALAFQMAPHRLAMGCGSGATRVAARTTRAAERRA